MRDGIVLLGITTSSEKMLEKMVSSYILCHAIQSEISMIHHPPPHQPSETVKYGTKKRHYGALSVLHR